MNTDWGVCDRGGYIEVFGEKWWSGGTLRMAEERADAAAAEIERLRADKRRLHDALEAIKITHAPDSGLDHRAGCRCYYVAIEAIDAAMGGDDE